MVANPRYIQARDHYQIAQNNYNVELQNYNLRYSNWIQAYNHHAQYGNQYIFAAGNPKPSSPSTYSLNGAAHILQKIPPQLQEDIYQDYQYPSYTFVKKYSLKCSFESHDFAGGSISPNDLFQRQDSDQYFFNREVHPEDTQVRQIPPPSPSKLKADYREFLRKSFSSIHSKIASSCEKRLETIFSEAVRDKDSFTAHRALLSKGTFSSEVAFIHNFIPDLFTEIRSGLSKSDAYAHYLQFYSEHLFDRSVGIAEVQTMLQGPWNVKTLSEQNLKPSAPRPLVTNPDAIKQTGLGQLDHVIKSTFTLKTQSGSGTGFVFHRPNLVITNYHVVEDSTEVRAYDHEGKMHLAKVIDTAINRDLALLRLSVNHFKPLKPGNSKGLKSGVPVYAVGSPGGLDHSVSKGIFSGSRVSGNQKLLQTDAPINDGNSGGPLVLANGQVVGVNVSKIEKVGKEGLGFAIPVEDIFTNLNLDTK
jgi:S1-C subfamily serine protease